MKNQLLLPKLKGVSMFFMQKEYVKYLLSSTNEHGVHSPFVFNFIQKCIYSSTKNSQKQSFGSYKSQIRKNHNLIEVLDFGAGSKVFRGSNRKISQIAKVAGIRNKYGYLLMRMMHYFEIKECLEIGTSLGLSSFCLANNNPNINLTTLEGCENTLQVAKKQLVNCGVQNINFVLGDFNETLPKLTENKKYDFVFFDGNHTKEATLNYFENSLSAKHNDSIFVFDDIHWSKGMLEAWQEIKQHPDVTVTLDLFQWGVVFFRKEQQKEHFIIRF